MKIPIVDKNDNIVAYKDRTEIDYKNDIFRTASLWITNSKNEVLLAQRKFDKTVDPGKWGEAVGGTVEGEDTYIDTITREAVEELGLSQIAIRQSIKQFLQNETYSCYIQWYTACIDKEISDLVIQEDEVEQVAWIPINEFKSDLITNPDKYVTGLAKCVELLKI